MRHALRITAACSILLALAAPLRAGTGACDGLQARLDPDRLAAVGLTSAQLAALDVLLCEADTSPGAPVEGVPATSGPIPPRARDDDRRVGLQDGPIESTVVGPVDGWRPGTVFVLANGQHWEVLKGSLTLPKPRASPTVRVVPGIAGRWFLEVDPDLPKARVFRAD